MKDESQKNTPAHEEDVDLEIFDALEQMGTEPSDLQADDQLMSADTIELRLDDDDMLFGEDDTEGGSAFRFDEAMSAGLEEELSTDTPELDLDNSFDSELDISEDNSFSLGLGEEQQDEGDVDLDLDENMTVDLGSDEEEFTSSDMGFDLESEDGYGFETKEFRLDLDENEMFSSGGAFDAQNAAYQAGDVDSEETGMTLETDLSDEYTIEDDGLELGEDFAKDFELDEGLAGLGEDIHDGGQEEDGDEFSGQTVIDVGDDQVVDLGSEAELTHEENPASETTSPPDAEEEVEEVVGANTVPTENTTEEQDVMLDLHDEDDDEDEDDFMASLGDITLDLEEESAEDLEGGVELAEEESGADEEDAEYSDDLADVVIEGGLDLTEEDEDEDVDMAALVQHALGEQGLADEIEEEEEEQEDTLIEEKPEPAEEEVDAAEEAQEMPEEPEPEVEEDDRAFLELDLRLSDEQMQVFERMMDEAHTLQSYLDNLDSHEPEVKESIYHKLFSEYIARKTVIFQDDECIALLADTEKDLQDMLVRREEFVKKVARLNEELEEIKVRHLVGEYDDGTLAEKEEAQNTEIALWNEKTEKIGQFITRYQHALDAENALNPIKNDQIPAEEPVGDSETVEESDPREETAPVEESVLSEDRENAEETDVDADVLPAEAKEAEETAEDSPDEEIEFGHAGEEDLAETTEPEAPSLLMKENADDDDADIAEEGEEDIVSFGGDAAVMGAEPASEAFGLDDEFETEFSMDSEEFDEEEFELDSLAGIDIDDEEEDFSYDIEGFGDAESELNDGTIAEDSAQVMVACQKCGRQTPTSEKFCVHCGGKAQAKATDGEEAAAMVSCKKCGRQTSASEKFCVHCGGKSH